MFAMIRSDYGRLVRLKSVWLLVLVVLAVLLPAVFKWEGQPSSGVYVYSGTESFLPLLAPATATAANMLGNYWAIFMGDPLSQASLVERLLTLLAEFEYIAVAVSVIIGVFYAQKIVSHYDAVQQSRGLTRSTVLIANLITIMLFAATFVTVSFAALLTCLTLFQHMGAYNPLATAWVAPGLYLGHFSAYPVLHLATMVAAGTCACFYTGSLAYLVARAARNVGVAAVAPVVLMWSWSSVAAQLSLPDEWFLPSDSGLRFMSYPTPTLWDGVTPPLGYLALGLGIFAALIGYSVLATVLRTRHGRTHR